jgi:beta-glucuronidase
MLRPRETPTRERRPLSGLWRFRLEGEPGWREAPVPASYNDLFADAAVRDHVGDAWYETTARVPVGERTVLRFDAATHRATVWVDGEQVAEHEGGYTPFEADITALLTPGEPVRITVRVNNELHWHTIPPGVVEDTPDGRRQRYFHDFFNYAGLHRPVWLYTTPRAFVRDITVVTGLDSVRYAVDADGDVRVVLRDAEGAEVARGSGADGELSVPEPRLWRPGEGYLYELTAELWDGSALVDSYPLPVGLRTVEVRGTQFLINGEPFSFRGFGRHEDAPVRGKAHDDAHMVHDFALMDWIGANSFRTSHYPYAEEVLEYADRRGVVVIDETAAVGLNTGLGLLGDDRFETYSDATIGPATQATHREAIAELIARDKNHPCVVMWSIANEPESQTDAARSYFEPLAAETRRLDPTRPIAFANMILAPPEKDTMTDLFDVVMVNRYYGWYADPGDLAAAERHLEEELRAWEAKHGKPIIVSEYGADAVAGLHGLEPMTWTEDYQAQVLEMNHRVFDRVEAVIGEHVWNFADFATGPGVHRVDGNRKGVFTRDRRPKAAAHLLRRRWRG